MLSSSLCSRSPAIARHTRAVCREAAKEFNTLPSLVWLPAHHSQPPRRMRQKWLSQDKVGQIAFVCFMLSVARA